MKDVLTCVIIMISELNMKYREEAAAEVMRSKDEVIDSDAGPTVWKKFFVEKFPSSSDARLILVLESLDKAEPDVRAALLGFLEQKQQEELNIQVVLTSRPDLESSITTMSPAKIDVTKEKVSQKSGDLWLFTIARCKSLSNLRRLKLKLQKRIAAKLRQKADSGRSF